ncbi:MAG: SRPBCC domain-containing protein, partial [Gemmatimonadota bacterium]
RRYADPIDDVWHACTDVVRLRRWFGDVRGSLAVGETVFADVGEKELVTCRVLRCERPRLLTITWAYGTQEPDEVELRLTSHGSGTTLELEHRFPRATTGDPEIGAGWEDWIYKLSVALAGGDGRAASSAITYPLLLDRWKGVAPG